MSSPYPVLENKPIDQLKVTELKEELKKRKLVTKGLKDELIRRLDEALRAERDVDAGNESEPGKGKDISNEKGTEMEAAAVQNVKITGQEVLVNNEMDETEELVNNDMETERQEEAVISERDIADEVVNKENDSAKDEVDNGFDCEVKLQVKSEDGGPKVIGAPVVSDSKVQNDSETGKLDNDVSMVDIDGSPAKLDQESLVTRGTVEVVSLTAVVDSVETKITESRSVVNVASNGLESQNSEIRGEKENSVPPHEDAVLNDSSRNNQVSEVSPSLGFQVKSDSISTDSVSINQKNELKDNLNADNFHIELDNVKPEMVQPSSSDVPRKGGDIHPLDDQEPSVQQGPLEVREDINATNMDLSKKNDSADGGSSEKLNLDRSSGDDSMEEDILESKQVESNHITDEVVDRSEVTVDRVMKEESLVDATGVGFSLGMKDVTTEINSAAVPVEKRKLEDPEIVRNNEPSKRQRRWNTETLKVPDPHFSTLSPSTTPKDAFQSKFPKRSFNRSDSTLSGGDTPKERVVPPSPAPPTTSLKIDKFLRPFTLKAVQELLGKTGTVCSFWMDHIKTHCFVTFSSVDEAIETRNALYNLQWPANGGRFLIAEFVDPQEVKVRAEAPLQPLTVPASNKPAPPPAPSQPQPSPRPNNVSKQQLPPPPSALPPPPPPMTDPHTVRERLPLPPPPPLIKKPDPPIVTLDDLFKKTRATPRIYYLPLSEEQVAAKLAMQQGKSNN